MTYNYVCSKHVCFSSVEKVRSWRDVPCPCPISQARPIGKEVATEKRNLDLLTGRLVDLKMYVKSYRSIGGGLLGRGSHWYELGIFIKMHSKLISNSSHRNISKACHDSPEMAGFSRSFGGFITVYILGLHSPGLRIKDDQRLRAEARSLTEGELKRPALRCGWCERQKRCLLVDMKPWTKDINRR